MKKDHTARVVIRSKSTAMATVRSTAQYNEGATPNFFVNTANESMLIMDFFDQTSSLYYSPYNLRNSEG
jgi:hypothetical protein